MFVVVRDQSVRVRELQVGVDTEMLQKWGSDRYVEHVLRRAENAGMVGTSEHMNSKADGLFAASSSHNPLLVITKKTGYTKPRETGVKIHIGGPIKAAAPSPKNNTTDADPSILAETPPPKEDGERKEEEEDCDLTALF